MNLNCVAMANSPIRNVKDDGEYKNVIENIESSIIFYFSGNKLLIYYNDLPTSILFDVIDYCRKNRLLSNHHKPAHKRESHFEPIPVSILSDALEKSSLKQSEYYIGNKNDMYKYLFDLYNRSPKEINYMFRYIKYHINDEDVKTIKQMLIYLQDLIEYKPNYFKTHKTLFTSVMIKFLKTDKRALLAHSVILFRIFSQRLGEGFRSTYPQYLEVFLENLKSEKHFVVQNSLQLIYELHPMFEPSSFMKTLQLSLRSCTNCYTKTNYLILLYQLLVDVKKDITKYCPVFLSLLFSMKDNYKPMKELRIIIRKYLMRLYAEKELYEFFYTYYYEQDVEKLKKLLSIPDSYKPYNNNTNKVDENEYSIKVGYHRYDIIKPIIPLGKSSSLLTTKASERKEINYYLPINRRSTSTNKFTSGKADKTANNINKKNEINKAVSLSKSQSKIKTTTKQKYQKTIKEDEIEKVISLEVLLKEYEDVVPCPVSLLEYFSDDCSYHTYPDSDSSSTRTIEEEEEDRFKDYSLDSEESSVKGDDDDHLQILLSSYEDSEEESNEEDNLLLISGLIKDMPVVNSSPVLLQEYFTDTNPYNSERESCLSDNGIEIESVDENKKLSINLSNSTTKTDEMSDVFLNLNDSEILQEDSYEENIVNK